MRPYYELFRHCPHCGTRYTPEDFDGQDTVFRCRSCRFDFYQNSKPSATVVIPERGELRRVAMITRGSDPGRGLLALPGGFLRYGEDPWAGARREAYEETRIEATIERALISTLVDYAYIGSRLWCLELAFLSAPVDGGLDAVTTPEASAVGFYDAGDLIASDRLAFPEQRRILEAYVEWLTASRTSPS